MTVELELVNAHAGYGSVEVLHGVGLALPTGAVVAVVGRNGAGKTTLLRTIAGTLPLNSGTVCWQGRDVTNQTAQQRATAGLTFRARRKQRLCQPDRRGEPGPLRGRRAARSRPHHVPGAASPPRPTSGDAVGR